MCVRREIARRPEGGDHRPESRAVVVERPEHLDEMSAVRAAAVRSSERISFTSCKGCIVKLNAQVVSSKTSLKIRLRDFDGARGQMGGARLHAVADDVARLAG